MRDRRDNMEMESVARCAFYQQWRTKEMQEVRKQLRKVAWAKIMFGSSCVRSSSPGAEYEW